MFSWFQVLNIPQRHLAVRKGNWCDGQFWPQDGAVVIFSPFSAAKLIYILNLGFNSFYEFFRLVFNLLVTFLLLKLFFVTVHIFCIICDFSSSPTLTCLRCMLCGQLHLSCSRLVSWHPLVYSFVLTVKALYILIIWSICVEFQSFGVSYMLVYWISPHRTRDKAVSILFCYFVYQ